MSEHSGDYPLRYAISERIEAPEKPSIDFNNSVNAVEDLNISSDGSQSICDAVENLDEGEKLVLPPGEYL